MRKPIWESLSGVLITTPNLILNDIEIIKKCHFDLVVCDDVSLLKNPGKITNAIRRIPRTRSWALNGTPLEIKPEDFVNVMEFVRPGLFSAAERANAPSQSVLQRKVKPHFLRRRKQDHLEGIPPISHYGPIQLEMEDAQREAYRLAEERQWKELQAVGVTINKKHIFSLISALLQICNVHLPSGQSAKAEAIEQELDKILDPERPIVKAIVFSRWVKTLEFLAHRWAKYCPQIYHGGLNDKERDAVLQKFRSQGCLLLMSIKAGNRGLNLQEANYVFHFDRTWNPVDEIQSEARCWRRGQKSEKVFVYGYTQVDTIEERIHQVLIRRKAQFEQYVNSMAEDTDVLAEAQWSIEELIELLRPTKADHD
jgi:SNF2 family DNA or RNA helicase